MKRLLVKLRRYYHIGYVFTALLATVVLLYFIVPGESRFRYDFQRFEPWQHENLVAPFPFAIYKSDIQYQSELDSIETNFVPYFKIDTLVSMAECQNFRLALNSVSIEDNKLRESAIDSLYNSLRNVYQAGIMSHSIENTPQLDGKLQVQIISDKSVIEVPVSSVYSLKSAFAKINNDMQLILSDDYQEVSKRANAVNFLKANLSYAETFSKQELEDMKSAVSQTLGMVQAGERIILKGDIITPQMYRVLESLKRTYESRQTINVDYYLLAIGKILIILISFLLLVFYFVFFRPQILKEKRHLSFILLLILFIVFAYSFVLRYDVFNIYVLPIVIMPILIRIFFDSRTAIFTHFIVTMMVGYFAPNNYEYIMLTAVAGVVAIFSLDKLHRRSDIVFTAIWVLVSYSIIYIAFSMVHEGNYQSIQWQNLKWFLGNTVLIFMVYPLIYVFEKLFGFVSDVTLIELSNTNHVLLRKLAEKTPGTFQHSLQVANLSESIARLVDANSYLAYVGALYHDIGKTSHPTHFIENQNSNHNPHSELSYLESAEIIISHVAEGVKLAKKHNLPEMVIDFIRTHHGTMQAKYFYTMHKNENPNENVDISAFTYPGPRPKTKETAIVMIVDGIEAATRALKEKTHENIEKLINDMVDAKIKEKQLDLAPLTLSDITIIRKILLDKLINIYHVRIEYPKEK